MPERPTFRYRDDVLAELWKYGVRPKAHTPPDLVRSFINDLYRHELRRLRDRYLRKEFPKREYLDRVVQVRDKYPVLALRPRVQAEQHRFGALDRRGQTDKLKAVAPPLDLHPEPCLDLVQMLIKRSAQFHQPDIIRRGEQHVARRRSRAHSASSPTRRPRRELGMASVMMTSAN